MTWKYYETVKVKNKEIKGLKDKFSITSDILSFQTCKRQYGYFAIRKYQPAHIVQIWYGTIIHQVLDKLHMHYNGLLDPNNKGLPTNDDVDSYFTKVENSLNAKGIRPLTKNVKDTALRVLQIFNRIEGELLYPNIKDTECKLQTDMKDFIMHGVVDVLKDTTVTNQIKGYENVEIWDYKGTKFPDTQTDAGKRKFQNYVLQLMVYAQLYKEKFDNYPLKGVLYFTNELNVNPEPIRRPGSATYEIDFRDPYNIERMENSLEKFTEIVDKIKECKVLDRWDAPQLIPDAETCNICDIRWDCPKVNYKMRYP